MTKWIWVGGLVMASGISAPWGVGVVTEQQWQQVTNEANASQAFFEVSTRQYERHFFSADIEGTLHIKDPGTGEVFDYAYRGDVSHGLLSSRVDFQPDGAPSELFAELFPDQRPTLAVTVNAWGSADVELTIPAIHMTSEQTGESLDSTEAYGWGTIADSGSELDMSFRWPGLTTRGPNAQFAVGNVAFAQTLRRLEGDVWIGDSRLTLDSLEVDLDAQPAVNLTGLSLVSEATAEQDNHRFSSGLTLAIDQVRSDEEVSGPHRATFVMNGLSVDAWNGFMAVLSDMQTLALTHGNKPSASSEALVEQQMALMLDISNALKVLAGAGMSFGFPEVLFTTPEGLVRAELMLQHPELTAEEQADMTLVMQRLTGAFKMSIPVAYAESEPALMAQLMPLIDQGMVVRDGEHFTLGAELKDLEIDVNGQTIPLPPMI
ncbi:DUF945 family protein [Marinobacter caseinilyticus]|uniref:DUF945 family protein n=1 Tax=Marinobacter caseinilyticus TaxID=2692195 RepID=UPI00140D58F6|nr:DUF945 family protein [Marinobacter caseinilyticus]